MALCIPRSSVLLETATEMSKECYIVENLSYEQKKHNITPKILRMYDSTDTMFNVPYHVGLKYGFKHTDYPWYCIQPMNIEVDRNLQEIDEESSFFRPFVGNFRDYQEDIMHELLAQIDEYATTTLSLPPGWGKTMAGIFLSWRLGLRTCVMMSLTKVLEGWIKTCDKFLPGFKVWVANSNEDCPEDIDIILCMDGRFSSISPHIIPTIGTLIVDEVHLLCTPTRVDIFLTFHPKYVILESATMIKANGFHEIAYLMAGKHGVYRISKIPYNIFIINTGITGEEEYGKSGLKSAKLRQSLVKNDFRQRIVLNILMQICNHHKTMCVRMVKESIPEFTQKIKNCGITADSMFGRKGDYNNSQVLVGTQQKMGTGFDEENACMNFYTNPIKSDVIIFENTTPNENIFEQTRGRVMRSDFPVVILLQDENRSSKRHIDALRPWFKETNGTIHTVSYTDFRLPCKTQIYSRTFMIETFYCVINQKELSLFQEFGILDNDMELFDDGNKVVEKFTSGFVLSLSMMNVASRIVNGIREFISLCPICSFHVLDIAVL